MGPPRTDQCRSPHSVMLFLYVCGLKIYIYVERKNLIFNWWTQNSLGENSNCFRWVCSLAKMRLFWQSFDRQERDKEKAELFYKRNWKEFWDSLWARESGEEKTERRLCKQQGRWKMWHAKIFSERGWLRDFFKSAGRMKWNFTLFTFLGFPNCYLKN